MGHKKVRHDGRNIINPVFKFQTEEHAKMMWQDGNVYLSNPRAFRNGAFGGLIDDSREGQVTLHYPSDIDYNYIITHSHEHISLDDVFIYCGSSDFFSETLHQALSDKKETCVLITDLDEVAKKISSATAGLQYIGTHKCIYTLREHNHKIVKDIGLFDFTNPIRRGISANRLLAGWIKPLKHSPQKEIRAIWKADSELSKNNHISKNVDIQDYLIPIDFSGIKPMLSNRCGIYSIGARVITIDGLNDAWFDMEYPLETFTPIIYKDEGEYLLGFTHPFTNGYNGRFNGSKIGVRMIENTIIGCSVPLKYIVKIEYRLNN